MKVVLREHVEHLGDRGQIVSVAVGYARNYLIPKRLAVAATSGNLKVVEQQRRVWAVKEAHEVAEAERMAQRLSGVSLTTKRKAGETGTLYGSVTNSDVAALLAGQGIEVDRRRIVLHEPIKAVGEYEIAVKIYRHINGEVRLTVESESPATPRVERADAPDAEDDDA